MLSKEKIIDLLESIHEHTMAKDIFVPVLQRMGLQAVKFTGGSDEQGIDIEYYEFTQPENRKSYVGIQFKKGSLVYSSTGSKNSVKEVRNQAEEAFEKEIFDIDDHSTQYISRFIVAVTGDINETARKFIGRVRQKGADRRIDYWTGDRLAEYIQTYWMDEFEKYFADQIEESVDEEEEDEVLIVDEDYLKRNYGELIERCRKVKSTVNEWEWKVIRAIVGLSAGRTWSSNVSMSDLLIELGNTEEYFHEEFTHLSKLEYIEVDYKSVSLCGHATVFEELYGKILEELADAGEYTEPSDLFDKLIE